MSNKLSKTTADFLTWEQNLNLIRKLYDDKNYKISLLLALGSFWGLRISDILRLKWVNILNTDEFTLIEGKTKKIREIKINPQLQKHILACFKNINAANPEQYIFLSQKNTVFTIQRINVILKEIKANYNLKIKNFSTHTMRKTFGRQIFEISGSNAELSLVKLSQLFNHSNPAITRRYLGIAREELLQTYTFLTF